FRVGHGVRLAAQVHDRVGYAPGDVDEGEIAQLAVGAVEARRELRGELEHEPGALGGDLAETRISHLGDLALIARADPGAARRLNGGRGLEVRCHSGWGEVRRAGRRRLA